jgi:N-acetylmuramoyl-L-alanine amidase
MKIVMSSGHGKYIRGAAGSPIPPCCDEVDEARKVVEKTAAVLRSMGVDVVTFHDDVSDDQRENLDRIVNFHNAQGPHDLDVSVHFNAYDGEAHGCEVLYTSPSGMEVADEVVDAICQASGLTNRGPKERNDLTFLNVTNEVAVLIETAFCDNPDDCNIYRVRFNEICDAIAEGLAGEEAVPGPQPPEPPIPDEGIFHVYGKCSWFGGPEDTGVSASEGLAFIYNYDEAPHLFLEQQPSGTTGLARRLNPGIFFVACRWDYDTTPKGMLANPSRLALVRAKGKEFLAWPADWGPHEDTRRVADLSKGLMDSLELETDDEVEIIYPAP